MNASWRIYVSEISGQKPGNDPARIKFPEGLKTDGDAAFDFLRVDRWIAPGPSLLLR